MFYRSKIDGKEKVKIQMHLDKPIHDALSVEANRQNIKPNGLIRNVLTQFVIELNHLKPSDETVSHKS